jgi:hypothetical protein
MRPNVPRLTYTSKNVPLVFVNTNTGYFGLCSRRALRYDQSFRQWIKHTTLDCRQIGSTSIRLKPNPNPTRKQLDSL